MTKDTEAALHLMSMALALLDKAGDHRAAAWLQQAIDAVR